MNPRKDHVTETDLGVRAGEQDSTVQQVRGSLDTHEQGLLISTGDFSSGARQEAQRANAVPVALMSGSRLVSLLVEHDIEVRKVTHHLIELDGLVPDEG